MPDDGRRDDIRGAGAAASAPDPFGRSDAPVLALTIWPHRSLSRRGSTWVLGLVTAGFAAPLLALLGHKAAWGLLPFLLAALIGLYVAIRRSFADGKLTEELRIWPDLMTVERREPRGAVRRWQANPAWVRPQLFEDGRIEQYLTLTGAGREIELGAFLSPPERVELYRDICRALDRVRHGGHPSAPR